MGFKIPIPWTNMNGFQNTHYLFRFLYCTSQNPFLWRNVTHPTDNSQMGLSLRLRPMHHWRAPLGHQWPSLGPPMLRWRSVGRWLEISDLTRSDFIVDPKGKKKKKDLWNDCVCVCCQSDFVGFVFWLKWLYARWVINTTCWICALLGSFSSIEMASRPSLCFWDHRVNLGHYSIFPWWQWLQGTAPVRCLPLVRIGESMNGVLGSLGLRE